MSLTITKKAGHLAWCALIALRLAQRDGLVRSDMQKNLFLTRWLATAQKQRRFCREVAPDINWLLKQGRTLGVRAKLPQKLDYLYRSCTGSLSDQSDLFRLTWAFESAKESGFSYQILSDKEWTGRRAVIPDNSQNALYLMKSGLDAAFDADGNQIAPLPVKISGDVSGLGELLKQCSWQLAGLNETTGACLYTLMAEKSK